MFENITFWNFVGYVFFNFYMIIACSYDTLNGSYSSGLVIHYITFGKITLCLTYNFWSSKFFSKFKENNRRCFCTPFYFIGGYDPRTNEHNCEFRLKGFARTWMDDPVIVSTGAYLLGAICTFMITDYHYDSNDINNNTTANDVNVNINVDYKINSGAENLFLSFFYLTILQVAAFFASLLYHRTREITYINLDMPIALSLLFVCIHSFFHASFFCLNQTVKYWKETENCEDYSESWMNKAKYNNCLKVERQKTITHLHLIAPAVIFIALLCMGLVMAGYLFKSCGLPGEGYWIAEKKEQDKKNDKDNQNNKLTEPAITNSTSSLLVNTSQGFVRESLTDSYDALHTYWHLLSSVGPLLCCMYWNHIYTTVALEMDTSLAKPWISESIIGTSNNGREVLGMGFLDEAEVLPTLPIFAIAAALAMNVALNIAGEMPFD